MKFETNAWGMRSPPVDRDKPADVFRVLIVGDSVVFGHTNVSQQDLATTLLGAMRMNDGRRIEALNVSAPSWGPGNQLAWLEANGTLDADAAILVVSSHDIDDDRTFVTPDTADMPRTPPISALADWIGRQFRTPNAEASRDPRSAGDARRSLPPLLDVLKEAPSGACIVLHASTDERQSSPGLDEIGAMASDRSIPTIGDRDFLEPAEDFIDAIHLNASGQTDLAEAMLTCPALQEVSASGS